MSDLAAPVGTVWIGQAHPFDLREVYVNFRADISLDTAPPKALLRISADNRYRLWINGVFAGLGPERSWPTSMTVYEQDVAKLLREGTNHIAVQVYSPGHSHFAYVHRGACGLIGWLVVDDEVVLQTRTQWKVRRDRSLSDQAPRLSISGVEVEDQDLRQTENWIEASQDPHADLRKAFSLSKRGSAPALLPRGTSSIWVFDLGESRAVLGVAEITVAGGERLMISYAETLRDGDLLLPVPETYCRMRPTNRFSLRPGRQRIEGSTPRGARCMVFAMEGGGVAAKTVFHVRLPATPALERPQPRRDDVLQGVAEMCRRTTLACL